MDKEDNYEKYKYMGLYILEKKPEFIIDYFNNSNFLKIVFDSYNLTNSTLVDYLINKHSDEIKKLLKKIINNDENYKIYKELGLIILDRKPEFITDYFTKDNKLSQILNDSLKSKYQKLNTYLATNNYL